jgi:hypothetical protein
MKRFLLSLSAALLLFTTVARADEGMWLPVLLDQLNITDMKARGFQLTAEDIYSVNHSSMKDAVCQFGGGCTAELISAKGLLLTNHHCGYSYIQYHSSVDHDYLTNGFWAMKQEEELPCPGLTVTFIVSMEDVTSKVLAGISDTTSEAGRSKLIDKNSKALEKANTKDGLEAMVRSFYYGNVFYMFMTQTFKDVRMVGAPPQTIGNFGGDSDNWVWPRQTGDFSLFRIYADKNNNPAEYSKDNVPYVPKHFFKINAAGVGENDFTMVYGFPGRTTEYLSSYGVNLIQNVSDPVKVDLRTKRIGIMEEEMLKNDTIRIQYAAKRNGAANAWKKWQGEMMGLSKTGAIAKKQASEKIFQDRVNADPAKKAKYGTLLHQLDSTHQDIIQWQKAIDYMNEGCFSVEAIRFAWGFHNLVDSSKVANPNPVAIDKLVGALKNSLPGFFKDFNANTDQRIAVSMFSTVNAGMPATMLPSTFTTVNKKYKGDFGKYFETVYGKTIFVNQQKLMAMLNKYKASDWKKLGNDPMFVLCSDLYMYYNKLTLPAFMKRNNEIQRLNRIYMAAQMEVFPERKFYPDANSTLRVAFGKIDDYSARDGMSYNWFCTLDGVMEKEDPNSLDYQVPPRLHQLWAAKDYGTYADKKDGKLHTSFIASNHTTGGNSGSPVLDANGNLIGTNFDRCWEGTMSDVNYDPSICRNIVLDVRYTLFIIDKYAGAGYLLKEMVIVQ